MKKHFFKDTLRPFLVRHEPEILMSMGIAGLLFATIWTVKATVSAVRAVDKKKEELNKDKLTFKETMGTVWKYYIPSIASTIISVPCIIAGNRVSSKRTAALAAAYTISETALQEYQAKARDVVGGKKEQEIREAVCKDRVQSTPCNTVLLTGDGDSLFFEPTSARYFKSSWSKILKAANELNAKMLGGEDWISLTDWYIAIGLEPTSTSDELGWSTSKGRKGIIDISLNSCVAPNDQPCGAIFYDNDPQAYPYK